MKRKPLPVPQHEFGFTRDTFNLFTEASLDGERLAREHAASERERQLANSQQPPLFTPEQP